MSKPFGKAQPPLTESDRTAWDTMLRGWAVHTVPTGWFERRAKRFTDAELAAEYWAADANCAHAWVEGEFTDEMQERFDCIERFAATPSYDMVPND